MLPANSLPLFSCECIGEFASSCNRDRRALRAFNGWLDYRAAGRRTQTESGPAAEFHPPPAFPLHAPRRAAPAGRRCEFDRPAGSAKPNRPAKWLVRCQRALASLRPIVVGRYRRTRRELSDLEVPVARRKSRREPQGAGREAGASRPGEIILCSVGPDYSRISGESCIRASAARASRVSRESCPEASDLSN